MDSAKGISVIGESNSTVKELVGDVFNVNPYVPFPHKTYPIIAVPTTCGTGSEVIKNAVITEPSGHKMVPMHECLLPAYAVCDPDLLATLPPHVAAATAMDAMVQAIECYVSLAANDFSETMSLRAVEHIGPNIVAYYHNRAIPELADHMSKGCMYGGIAWNTSFVAQIHGSNHPITELLHISHGDACAILFPPFIEWNGGVAREKFWKVYNLMCPDAKVELADFDIDMLVQKAVQINRDLNIMNGKSMADYGCTEETVDIMLAPVNERNGMAHTYPRTQSYAQLKEMYMDVMNGKYL
jgi:alcohol dehydrogenase class IV